MVVATDMNIRFLDNADAANLTIRQQNILTAELEQAWYNLVYARLVLSHLNSDQKVVKRMADAVRPGGWPLIEDYDWGFPRAADPEHLSAQFFNGVWRAAEKAARKSGTLDPNTGGRLRELLVSAGLVNVEHEGVVRSGRGGDTYARLSLLQMEAMMPSLKPTGLITDQDLVRAKALLEDPSFFFLGVGRFAAWGRRPA